MSPIWGSDGALSNALRLRGVMDFDLVGSNGKAFHLYAQQDIPDLSIFGIGVANNGGGSDGQEQTLRRYLFLKEIIFYWHFSQ